MKESTDKKTSITAATISSWKELVVEGNAEETTKSITIVGQNQHSTDDDEKLLLKTSAPNTV